jgi:16S rRNA (guanine966-N2)-methyltransferase
VRVIAGTKGGLRIDAPPGRGTRPTSELVRGAIFNSVGAHFDLVGARVADLFAGSGALGIEALSRGAESAVFVESDRTAVAVVQANLVRLGLDGQVSRMTVEHWVTAGPHRLDITFADPPYGWSGWPDLLSSLATFPVTVVVAESTGPIAHPEWEVVSERRHGDTVVTLLVLRKAA